MNKKPNIAVVGATGLVGTTFRTVLQERNFPYEKFYAFTSAKSAGSEITFDGNTYKCIELKEENIPDGIDIALFSAGGSVSEKFAPIFAEKGAVVVDNSSQWRMDKNVPLIVPEVNPAQVKNHNGIIANPNCSTIQAMLPLKPIHDKYQIKRVIYSTYQAVSGSGLKGINDLKNGIKFAVENRGDLSVPDTADEQLSAYAHPIFDNCLPHIDVFLQNDYTKEEMKMVNETKKILEDENMKITATTVRVPVFNSHSESINIETVKPFEIDDVKKLLSDFQGIIVVDDPQNNAYPLARTATGKDEVFVGRIRRDESIENGLNLFVVADNIRKGAATNAVQIAELLLED